MSVGVRLLWFVVALTLVAGAVVVTSVSANRSEAAEDLRIATKRLDEMRAESREQPIQINQIKEDIKELRTESKDCYFVVLAQIASLNLLLRQTRRVSDPARLEPFGDLAREFLLGFRQLLEGCQAV